MARPNKRDPTPEETALAQSMRANGRGLASIAKEISHSRGAHLMTTEAAANKRKVSARWVGRKIFGANPNAPRLLNSKSVANLRQNKRDQQ